MRLKRWAARGVVGLGLVAAACGGAATVGNGSGDAEEGAGAAPAAQTEPPLDLGQAAAPADSASALPPDADVTPGGDSIIRQSTPVPVYAFTFTWNTNWDIRIIELDELQQGGPPRDGIPSIDAPRFITVPEADAIYPDNSPVIQFEVDGDVRAYPLDILIWHEIVNDTVGGVPVAVTFCPLCNTAITFDRRLAGLTLEFGTSGLLRRSDLVMYDRTTETLWQQIGGAALVGDLVGARLQTLPASIVSWQQFRANFPDGLVLSRDTGFVRDYGLNPYTGYDNINNTPFLFRGRLDERLSPFERVVTLDLGDALVAYPFVLLEDVRVFQDRRGGREIAVFWAPGASSALDAFDIDEGRAVGSTGVFARELDGRLLNFAPNPDDDQTFLDGETGSVWNIFGEALSGSLAGSRLEPLVHADYFWFAWAAFQPDTEVVTG